MCHVWNVYLNGKMFHILWYNFTFDASCCLSPNRDTIVFFLVLPIILHIFTSVFVNVNVWDRVYVCRGRWHGNIFEKILSIYIFNMLSLFGLIIKFTIVCNWLYSFVTNNTGLQLTIVCLVYRKVKNISFPKAQASSNVLFIIFFLKIFLINNQISWFSSQ